MRKLFLLIIVFIFSWICINSCTETDSKKELIQNAIMEEMNLHPEARLVDIYKFFFQGTFGPWHIISDNQSALNYLQNELHSTTDFDSVL